MNKPLPIECLRKWAGAWLEEQRCLISRATDARLRDIESTRLPGCYSVEVGTQDRVHNLRTEHDAYTKTVRTILGILRKVGYGRRTFVFRPTFLAAGAL